MTLACVDALTLRALDPIGREQWRIALDPIAPAQQRPLLHINISALSIHEDRVFMTVLSAATRQPWTAEVFLRTGQVKRGDK